MKKEKKNNVKEKNNGVKEKNNGVKEKRKNKKQYIIISLILVGLMAIGILTFLVIKNNTKKNDVCILQYNVNGGNQINSLDTKCGTKIDEPVPPEKEGFNFVGWFIENEKVDFDNFYLFENTTIEAKWEVKQGVETVVVSFDTTGGSEIKPIELAKGEILVKPLDPTLYGYKFSGWYYNYEVFDFSVPIYENITLKAKWEEKKNNNTQIQTSSSSNQYKCSGSYRSDVPVKNVTVGYSDHVNWTWSTHGSYGGKTADVCYITYKSSDSSIATVNQKGIITTQKAGTVYISACINDSETKTELVCFKGKLIISNDNSKEENNNNQNNKDIGFSFSDIQGTWYKTGTNDETVTFTYTDGVYMVEMMHIDDKTLESTRGSGGGWGGVHWESFVDYYNIKNVSKNNMTISRGSRTLKLTRTPSIVKVNRIVFKNTKQNLMVGESNVLFEAYLYPGNANDLGLKWTSSDTNVVSVLGNSSPSIIGIDYKAFTGYLEANGVGTATITVSSNDGGATASFKVTVSKNDVSSISLNKASLNLSKGNSEILTATISPTNASDKNVTWSSSNTSVATVNSSGKVTAVSNGKATITVTTKDGGYTAKCEVTVTNPPLTATGSIGVSTIASSSGTTRGVSAQVNASGGTGTYTYYYIKLYKDGTLIGTTTNTSSNKLFISGYSNGSYTMEYEVRDSEGTIKTGTSSSTISGF